MSLEPPSSNPFRRKAPPVSFRTASTRLTTASLPPIDTEARVSPPINVERKKTKVVKFQSPPPSSPQDGSIPKKPPTPVPRFAEHDERYPELDRDSFAELSVNAPSSEHGHIFEDLAGASAPANPFSKTLVTIEHTEDNHDTASQAASKAGANTGRASMDVETFKRMLMTGNPSAVASPSVGSSTDTSSMPRKTSYDDIHEVHMESPRSSYDMSEDEHQPLHAENYGAIPEKRKPVPPSHKHGKLIKLDLGALPKPSLELSNSRTSSPSQLGLIRVDSPLRSPIDVHKPLPAPPSRASYESDRSDIFDREAIGKIPEPDSPVQTQAQVPAKFRPPPPPTRRHSQLVADSKLNPILGRLSPSHEEDDDSPRSLRSALSSPPPPPPQRRPWSIRHSSHGGLNSPGLPSPSRPSLIHEDRPTSAKSGAPLSAPPPPPSRHSSFRSARPLSIASVDMSHNRRSGTTPPPPLPPPRRERASSRNSLDGPGPMVPAAFPPAPPNRRTSGERRRSGEFIRRSIDSARRGSINSITHTVAEEEENFSVQGRLRQQSMPAIVHKDTTNNALADIEALQREIDELRRSSAS